MTRLSHLFQAEVWLRVRNDVELQKRKQLSCTSELCNLFIYKIVHLQCADYA